MKKLFIVLCLLLFLLGSSTESRMIIPIVGGQAVAPASGNDFSGDSNVVALYKFESGALTTDSNGTNTLTANGTPVADTSAYKEGAASVDYPDTGSDYHSITNAGMDGDHPLKSGVGPTDFSIAMWFRIDTDQWSEIFSSWDATKYAFRFIYNSGDGSLRAYVGTGTGSTSTTYENSSDTLAIGTWNHICLTYDYDGGGDDATLTMYVWEDGGVGDWADYQVSGSVVDMNVEDGALGIGAQSDNSDHIDGRIDELVIFKDIINGTDCDNIRNGTYGS